MFTTLLALHSLLRWLVLVSLLFAIFLAYHGWFTKRNFTKLDNTFRLVAATSTHVQFLIGLWLYFVSPTIAYFLQNFKEAVHQSEVRFFGIEHNVTMLIAIVVITIGSAKAKRKETDAAKFKTMAIWFTIGLLIMLISIPWSFSPMVSRPDFRSF